MNFKQCLVLSLLCIVIVLVDRSNATCGCESNGIACKDRTSFHMCYNNDPDTTTTFTCPEGQVCTNLGARCLPESDDVKPACLVTNKCRVCDGTSQFVCTSRTTFVQCNKFNMTGNKGTCPDGMYCRSTIGELCVKECLTSRDGIECDRAAEEVLN